MVIRTLGLGVACASLLSCSDTTTNAPTQLNLDRPVDIAFACLGGLRLTGGGAASADQEVIVSAQPLLSCDVRSGARSGSDLPTPPGQENIPGSSVPTASYYAFILQSGPGTVAVARFDTKPSTSFSLGDVEIRDADPLTPGKNSITVGEDPIAIVTDRVGCYEVVANAGSCDLSVLDVNSAVDSTVTGVDPTVNKLTVKDGSGNPILARPTAMVVEPAAGTIGEVCPATPTGLVYIAYPGCHTVAAVDVSTGTVVTHVDFDAAGVPTVVPDGNLSCPAECDGSGVIAPGFRPVALDLEQDARSQRRLLTIGADNSNLLTLVDLDLDIRPFGAPVQVALQNTTGRLGITNVAISPLIGMGGDTGAINDDLATAGDHQFVYAVANDGTVRVVDVTAAPRECDTQVDPRYLRDVHDVDILACMTVGDAATPPRRAGARGPGIELVGDNVPTSVDTFRVEENPADTRDPGTPDRLIGYFGVITASNGQSFVFNIDDDDRPDSREQSNPFSTQVPLTIPHQLRDDVAQRGLVAEEGGQLVCDDPGPAPDVSGGAIGGARLAGNIQRTVPAGTLATEKTGGLPSIRQVFCDAEDEAAEDRPVSELYFSAPLDVRESVFPDLRALRSDETWSLTWEGSLSLDTGSTAVDGPAVRESQMYADGAGLRMVDAQHPYCDLGVEPYDVVQLRGCDPSLGDAGCPIGYTCYVHPQSQVSGLGACMLENEAERLANACKPFLTSLRRYTVGRTKSGELQLLPRKFALRTTPTTGCSDDAQCASLAKYAISNASSANPVDDTTADDTHTWACQVDPDRKPGLDLLGQPLKRCLATCDDLERSSDCATGTVCTAHPGAAPKAGYCMEGVTPPQSCINAPQRYEMRAGEAFALVGSRSGYIHPWIADVNGSCVRDPSANPYQVARIPLRAPACDPTADPLTGALPGGGFEPNPCQLTTPETEYQLNYEGETCTLGTPDESIVTRDATALRLRHRGLTLTLVDPTYQGDLRCNGDRGGSLVNVPLMSPGYQIAFRQALGFVPKFLKGISPSFPIKVTRGPGQSIWIIDQGDFLSTSITQASTRGKVYRVEAQALGTINLLE
jgi:hypothetical protein